jgi:hypothetical protein
MQLPRLLAVIALVALLAFGSLTAWSQQSDTGSSQASSSGRFMGPPPPGGICADGQNVYVLQGPWIYQFSASDLSFKKKVQLPRPEPPEGQRQ